jgi:hypothetical protein
VTEEQGNISEIAHIWSFAKQGPRGQGPFVSKPERLNELQNLVLVCHDCHKTIDADKAGLRYSAKLLAQWKDEHERRIAIVAGVHPSKKSHVLLYGANIGNETSKLDPEHCKAALFPQMYPANERPLCLSMSWEGKDDRREYWQTELHNLVALFDRDVRPLIKEGAPGHFSVFCLAPMPLLMKLGSLLTEKVGVDVYQLHREPHLSWHWQSGPNKTKFNIRRPARTKHPPALIISLSDRIKPERVWAVVGKNVSVWELTIGQTSLDCLKSRDQLADFRDAARRLLAAIGQTHGLSTPLAIFPAMPVACAVEFGRMRVPKACMPFVIYDHNPKQNRFTKTITIGGRHERSDN